jgi:hypothetical protein
MPPVAVKFLLCLPAPSVFLCNGFLRHLTTPVSLADALPLSLPLMADALPLLSLDVSLVDALLLSM